MNRINVFFLVLVFMTLVSAFAQDGPEMTASGRVSDIDWVGSTLTLYCLDSYGEDPDEINFRVTDDSKLTRGSSSISFSDILQGDQVSITYYNDGFSGLKIKHLADLNRASG